VVQVQLVVPNRLTTFTLFGVHRSVFANVDANAAASHTTSS
jgi:hypothetical protein